MGHVDHYYHKEDDGPNYHYHHQEGNHISEENDQVEEDHIESIHQEEEYRPEEEQEIHATEITPEQLQYQSVKGESQMLTDIRPGVKGSRIFNKMMEFSQQQKSHYDPLKLQERREAFALG